MPFRLLCAGLRPGETDFPIFLLMPPRVPAAGRQLRAEGDGKPAQRRHAVPCVCRNAPEQSAGMCPTLRERTGARTVRHLSLPGRVFRCRRQTAALAAHGWKTAEGERPRTGRVCGMRPGYAFGLLYGTAPCRTRVIPLERFIVEKGKARGGTAPPGQK